MNELKRNGSGYHDPTASIAMQHCLKNSEMKYLRGDIVFVKKSGYVTGSEQDQGRPAVIISNNTGNHFSNILEVVYLTSKEKKPLPTHVEIMCRVPSTALCEQISSVSKDRIGEFIRSATDEEMESIDRALMCSLALDKTPDSTATVENGMIDDLKMKLECAERELCDKKTEIADLIEKLKSARSENKLINIDASRDILKVETERDLYKSLYEQMFEKMIG